MNEYVVILGASRYGVEAAFKCGFKTVVVTDRNSSISTEISKIAEAVFYVQDIEDKDHVLLTVKKIINLYGDVELVLSFTELGLETAAYISEKLNLKTNSLETVVKTRNKGLMRQVLQTDPELRLDVISGKVSSFPRKFPYLRPAIIKPLDGFGSKGVCYISNQNDWEQWLEANQDSSNEWILEPYINGPEYSVETVSSNGNHLILGITEKQTTGKPNFIEIGHIVPTQLENDKVEQIEQLTIKALNLLNIQYGPGHIEIKWDLEENKPVIIEIHTRPGGDFIPYLHQLSSDLNQYELGILSYFDEKSINVKPIYKRASLVKFLTFPEGILQQVSIEKEINKDYIKDWAVYYKLGDYIRKTTDSYTRSGHVIVSSSTVEESKRLCDNFINNLKYKIIKNKESM